MAGCAISSTTNSGWCMNRWPSARCCGPPRRTSSGRCASCCPTRRACGRPGCCGSGCSSMTTWADGSCCRGTRTLDLRKDPAGKPLKPGHRIGFEYSDGWVDDARLVALNARDAADRGASIRTRTKVVSARRADGAWTIETLDAAGKARDGQRPGAGQRHRPVGRPGDRRGDGRQRGAERPAGQGQPHRRARSSSTTTAATSSRTPTTASSSPSPMSATSR